MSTVWLITNPAGAGTVTLATADGAEVAGNFRLMATSTATVTVQRDYDSAAGWWAADALVTIYRSEDGGETITPYFTGRVIETPTAANSGGERRTLQLADAWQDLEDITYQEQWAIGTGAILIPKAILGLDAAGENITTGAQIIAAISYAITEGAALQLGTVDAGVGVWPSEVRNISCAEVILGEMRWNPQFAAWLDHSTTPPTFHARTSASLATTAVDIASENVESFDFSQLVQSIPRGVRILYEDASNIDGEVYRNSYMDTAGETTGRRIIHATIELAGMNQQNQKSRIRTRPIPAEAVEDLAAQRTFLKENFPTLTDIPDAQWTIKNFKVGLAVDPGGHAKLISTKAPRLEPADKEDLPRQLVNGGIEDWMRKKVGQINITYDLVAENVPTLSPQLGAFLGTGRTFTITGTNATTKLYKSTSSFTEGEGVPVGIAAAVFAAAAADKYQGQITLAQDEIPTTAWLGRTVTLMDSATEIMPPSVIHSVAADINAGTLSLEFGPLPYLSAGDFTELQRMARGRPVTWMSPEERASNQIGAEDFPGAKGDTVGGYDFPNVITPPGGGAAELPYWPTLITIPGEGEALPTYAVTVTPGWVREIKTGTGDALAYHKALNHFEGVEPATDPVTYADALAEHAIEEGQAVYITVQIDANGRVSAGESEEETPPVEIEVADDEEESIQYIPKVDDGTPDGAAGTLRLKLASWKDADLGLEMVLAGTHIDWTPPLPAFLTAWNAGEGVAIIFKEWDNAGNCYRVRAVTQKDPVAAGEDPPTPAQAAQIHVLQAPNRIIIQGNSKIREGKFRIGNGSEQPYFTIDDGLETLGTEEGNEETINVPTVVPWEDDDAQIQVTDLGVAGGVVYEVRGNGNDAEFTISVNGESGETLLECKDGLVISESKNININALPEGGEGDLLVHDGTGWVVLPPPGGSTLHVLGSSGGVPGWVATEGC